MAKEILIGQTDYSCFVFIPDPASTDGSGKTGLVAANLTVSYARMETDNDATVTDVTSSLNNLAALTTAHTDWGLIEVSSTLAPGLYRLDIADAVFASGAWTAVVYVMITSSAAAASPIEFELVAVNKLDAVRMGMTALPNAAADGAGGLPISDAGGLDLDARLDAAVSSRQVAIWAAANSTVDLSNTTIANVDGLGDEPFSAQVGENFNLFFQNDGQNTARVVDDIAIGGGPTADEIRNAVTGGAYSLSTDANGRVRIVDGTGTGELNTNAGAVALVDLVTDVTTKTGYRLSATGVDDVWDEAISGHLTGGSVGAALNAAGSAGDPWSTTLPGAYSAGTAGYIIGTNINATVSSRASQTSLDTLDDYVDSEVASILSAVDTEVASIKAITDQMVFSTANRLNVQVFGMEAGVVTAAAIATGAVDADALATDAVNEIRAAITGGAYAINTDAGGSVRVVDGTGTGEINTASGAIVQVDQLGTQAKADVNAEILDALATDTHAQPGQGTPPTTTSYSLMWRYIYKHMRNRKTQSASEFNLYNDDGTTVDQKALVSDNTTVFDFGELVTGP